MSRALILIAQTRFLKRALSPEEVREVLAVWADLAAGQRVYVPEPEPQGELFNTAADYRRNGHSIRHIAKLMQVSKSQVHRLLSQNSRLPSGQEAEETASP